MTYKGTPLSRSTWVETTSPTSYCTTIMEAVPMHCVELCHSDVQAMVTRSAVGNRVCSSLGLHVPIAVDRSYPQRIRAAVDRRPGRSPDDPAQWSDLLDMVNASP